METKNILLARIGWMKFYAGSQKGDERPIGGGEYNEENVGGEVVNFKNINGHVYASFVCGPNGLKLERINPDCKTDQLKNATLVFCARKPPGYGQGQVVIGWYKNATLYRNFQKIGNRSWIAAKCETKNAVLLPTYNRNCMVPSGEGSIGQKNISYLYNHTGKFIRKRWFKSVSEFIHNYDGPNILHDPDEELQSSENFELNYELVKSSSQGFSIDPKSRKYVELHAMNSAIRYYKNKGFIVKNISSTSSCDLMCDKGKKRIYVEVKGSQLGISKIILTKNEVRFIKQKKGSIHLFLKENIRYKKNKAYGGNYREIINFSLKTQNLLPLQYIYNL